LEKLHEDRPHRSTDIARKTKGEGSQFEKGKYLKQYQEEGWNSH